MDRVGLVTRLLGNQPPARVARFVESRLEGGLERRLGRAQLALDTRPARALREVEAALRAAPESARARALRLLLARPELEADRGAPLPVSAPLTSAESAVVAGWRARARADWEALAEEEPRLAKISSDHPLHEQALLLRASWRAHADRARARESLVMLDALLARSRRPLRPALWQLRARAAVRAGDAVPVLESLQALAASSEPLPAEDRREAQRVLAGLAVPDDLVAWKRSVARAVQRAAAPPRRGR